MTKKEMKKKIKEQEKALERVPLVIKMLIQDNKDLEKELTYYKEFASDMIIRVQEHG